MFQVSYNLRAALSMLRNSSVAVSVIAHNSSDVHVITTRVHTHTRRNYNRAGTIKSAILGKILLVPKL